MDDAQLVDRASDLQVGTILETSSETITVGSGCLIVQPWALHDEPYEVFRMPHGAIGIRPHPA